MLIYNKVWKQPRSFSFADDEREGRKRIWQQEWSPDVLAMAFGLTLFRTGSSFDKRNKIFKTDLSWLGLG